MARNFSFHSRGNSCLSSVRGTESGNGRNGQQNRAKETFKIAEFSRMGNFWNLKFGQWSLDEHVISSRKSQQTSEKF